MTLPRLRQVVIAARKLRPVAHEIEQHLGLSHPFRDPGVGFFGLENAVFNAGDSFVEVVAPVQDGTAVGRFLDRTGGDGGYMVMFEVADEAATRRRLADLGVRVVFDHTEPDTVDLHLHPKDVPGAIVALDVCSPAGSWRWGGPAWTATVPAHAPGGVRSITIAADDPDDVRRRWADVLGVDGGGTDLALDGGRQRMRFVTAAQRQGLVAATLALPQPAATDLVGGVDFTVETAGS